MTPDAAGRPERSDLTVDQHRMVAPSRVWLMPPPGDPTWYAGTWKSNPLTVVVGDVPYVPESEVTRLRADLKALLPLARLGLLAIDANSYFPVRAIEWGLIDWHRRDTANLTAARAILDAAHKGEG